MLSPNAPSNVAVIVSQRDVAEVLGACRTRIPLWVVDGAFQVFQFVGLLWTQMIIKLCVP